MTASQHSVLDEARAFLAAIPERPMNQADRLIQGLVEQLESAEQKARDMEKAASGMSADLTRFGTAMVEAQDHLRPSHAAYRILGAALNPARSPE